MFTDKYLKKELYDRRLAMLKKMMDENSPIYLIYTQCILLMLAIFRSRFRLIYNILELGAIESWRYFKLGVLEIINEKILKREWFDEWFNRKLGIKTKEAGK